MSVSVPNHPAVFAPSARSARAGLRTIAMSTMSILSTASIRTGLCLKVRLPCVGSAFYHCPVYGRNVISFMHAVGRFLLERLSWERGSHLTLAQSLSYIEDSRRVQQNSCLSCSSILGLIPLFTTFPFCHSSWLHHYSTLLY